jgi:hypothetical protein
MRRKNTGLGVNDLYCSPGHQVTLNKSLLSSKLVMDPRVIPHTHSLCALGSLGLHQLSEHSPSRLETLV